MPPGAEGQRGLRLLARPSSAGTQLVLAQSLRPVVLGLIVGAVLAVSLGRAVLATRALLGEVVRVVDPAAYAASVLVIAAACLLAALVPALRAARIDPIATLREE